MRPNFTPDGTKISYLKEDAAAFRSVWTRTKAKSVLVSVNLDGSDKKTVAELEAEVYEVLPSPDWRWLAFAVREDILAVRSIRLAAAFV